MKNKGFYFIIILFCMLLAGCWDRREINDVGFVLTSGFDIEDKKYKISMFLPLITKESEPQKGKKSFYVDTQVGNDENEILSRMEQRTSREINFDHRREVLFSEQLARQKGLAFLLNSLINGRQNRLPTIVAIVKKDIKKLLEVEPQLDKYPGERIREILKINGLPSVNVQDVFNKILLEGIDPIISVFDLTKVGKSKQIQFSGFALFSKDKLVDIIPKEEMRPYIWLGSLFQVHKEKINVSGKMFGINVDEGKKSLKVKKIGGKIKYQFTVDASGEIIYDASNLDLSMLKNISFLERKWEHQLTDELKKAISKLKDKQCDLMGAGLKLHTTYPEEWKRYKKNWYKKFAQSEFDVQVKVRIRHFGNTTNYQKGDS